MAAQKGTKSVLDYIRANCPKVCDQLIIVIMHQINLFNTFAPLYRLAAAEEVEEGKEAKARERKGRGKDEQVLSLKKMKLRRFAFFRSNLHDSS